jgi:hypothetical protein
MRLSYIALVSAAAALPAAALPLGIYVTYMSGSPASGTITEAPTALAEATASQVSLNEAVSVSNRTAEGTEREIAAIRKELKELTHLRAEVSVLRAEVSTLRQQWRAQGPRQAAATDEEEATSYNLPTDPVVQAEENRRRQEHMAALEAAFRQEPVDHRWSSQTELAVQEALVSNEAAQTMVRNVECRSRTCRLEVIDDGGDIPAVDFMSTFAMQVGPILPSIAVNHVEDANGVKTMILYLSRDVDEPPHEGG